MASASKKYITASYFLISVVCILLESQNMLKFVHSVSQWNFIPIRQSLYNFKIFTFAPLGRIFVSSDEVRKYNNIELKNAQLEAEISRMYALKEENIQMRRLLDAGLSETWKFEPAKMIMVTADTALISGGKSPNSSVVISIDSTEKKSGVYVGQQKDVVGNLRKITFATSVESKIPVTIRDKNTLDKRAMGLIVGKGGKAVVDQVLSSEELVEGDIILTNGDGEFPPNLLIGYVGKILKGNNSLLKQAELTNAIDVRFLENVFVVTNY